MGHGRRRERKDSTRTALSLRPSNEHSVMSAPPQAKEPHLLSLKVLRAARPSLVHSPTPYYESTSLGGAALRELDLNSVGSGDAADFGLSGVLQLPSTFGTIYLGCALLLTSARPS